MEAELKEIDELKSKACLFNLIIYCYDENRLTYFTGLIRAILERFPCRILLIKASDEGSIQKRWASINRREKSGAEGNEHSGLYEFSVPIAEGRQVPFLVLPHLVSDLPVFTLWGGELDLEAWILRFLMKLSDRLIVDSESSHTLQRFAAQVVEGVEKRHWELVDLNWMRMFGWREGLSHLFRESKRFEELQHADQIEILYSARHDSYFHHSSTQAIYLQEWLAEEMGWKRLSGTIGSTHRRTHYRTNKGGLEVVLRGDVHEQGAPGTVMGVTINSSLRGTFRMIRDCDLEQLKVFFETEESCHLPISIPFKSTLKSSSLLSEVFYSRHDYSYLKMLHQLVAEGMEWKKTE